MCLIHYHTNHLPVPSSFCCTYLFTTKTVIWISTHNDFGTVCSRENKTCCRKFCASFDDDNNMPFYLRWLVTANEVGDKSLTVSSMKAGERQVSKQLVNLLNICTLKCLEPETDKLKLHSGWVSPFNHIVTSAASEIFIMPFASSLQRMWGIKSCCLQYDNRNAKTIFLLEEQASVTG